jgi:splicing factor U2AF subunit
MGKKHHHSHYSSSKEKRKSKKDSKRRNKLPKENKKESDSSSFYSDSEKEEKKSLIKSSSSSTLILPKNKKSENDDEISSEGENNIINQSDINNNNNNKTNDNNDNLKKEEKPTSLTLKNENNNTLILRTDLYNTKELQLNIYSHYHYVDINTISNLGRKLVIYNLPEVNDDEIQQYFTTLLNQFIPNSKIKNPIISLEKRDNGFYYIIELISHDNVEILKNFDQVEWRNYRIRISQPRDFFRDYNNSQGSIVIPKQIERANNILSTFENKKNNKLYMTGIPLTAKEEEIKKIAESFGQIKYFNLIPDQNDINLNRGFCFFEYVNEAVTERAIKGLNNLQMGDKKLHVQRANENNNNNLKIATEILKKGKEEQLNPSLIKKIENKGFIDKGELTIEDLEIQSYATIPSRVLLFINGLTPEDLIDDDEYKDIVEDIREEFMKYGTVLNVEIPRPDKETHICPDCVGKIFIKFSTIESSKKARFEISGRRYNGRILVGSFYPEMYFDIREFNYREGDK